MAHTATTAANRAAPGPPSGSTPHPSHHPSHHLTDDLSDHPSDHPSNEVRPLNFSGRHIGAELVTRVRNLAVSDRVIAVNTGTAPAVLAQEPQKAIAPLSSAVLCDTSVQRADTLLLLRVGDRDLRGLTAEPGWQLLADLLGPASFPADTELWRSPQDDAGRVSFVPEELLGEDRPGPARDFRVLVNLWFAPAGTDCRIHRIHEFIEVHTQVHGFGRMQKFREPDHGTLHQDVALSPGATHEPFCATGPGGTFVYPWHQYRADTDCVWLAVEYHEVAQTPAEH